MGYYTPQASNCLIKAHLGDLSIFHLNIRSLNANYIKLLDLFSTYKKKFDIIILSEIWGSNIDFFDNIFPDYHIIFSSPLTQRAGGVAIFILNKFSYNFIASSKDTNFFSNAAEFIVVDVIANNFGKIRFYCFYRHPSQPTREFIDLFFEFLAIYKPVSNSFIVGDMNLNLLNYNSDRIVGEYVNNLVNLHFTPFSIIPTRCTRNSSSLIDHVFTTLGFCDSNDCKVKSLTVMTDITDHYANLVIITSRRKQIKYCDRPFIRIYSGKNIEKFAYQLQNLDWSLIYNSEDVDKSITFLIKTLTDTAEVNFPLIKCSRKKLKDKPWITKELKNCIKIKNNLFYKFKQSKDKNDEMVYKAYRNKLDKRLRHHRVSFYHDLLNDKMNSIKCIWKTLNSICSYKRNSSNSCIKTLATDGGITRDKTEMVNVFNNYFSSIGKNLASKIAGVNHSYKKYLNNSISSSFFMKPVSISEVYNTIRSLKNISAAGSDNLNTKILKLSAQFISAPLSHIINLSFQVGHFPTNFKVSKVIPIHKNGSLDNKENYRPISLLSNLSKIFEKIMYERISNFFNKNDIWYENQFGFRSGHSTVDALFSCTNMIRNEKGNKNFVMGLFFDLTKAFDTVNHSILLDKLWHYGVRGLTHTWFKSYLSGRFQYTVIDDICSSVLPVDVGVPQGSILGPLLFSVYINDIQHASSTGCLKLFADDSSSFVCAKNLPNLFNKANIECMLISDWCKSNRLTINYSKSVFMIFFPTEFCETYISENNLSITVDEKSLSRVKVIKFLGVLIDEKLTFAEHIKSVTCKINSVCGMLYKRRDYIPINCRKNLYFSLVYSRISYGLIVYGKNTNKALHPLHIANNRALRILQFQDRLCKTKLLYVNYNTLPIYQLYKFLSANLIYRCIFSEGSMSKIIRDMIRSNLSNSGYHTRLSLTCYLSSTTNHANYLTNVFECCCIWNSIPVEICNLKSYVLFKRYYKSFLIDS